MIIEYSNDGVTWTVVHSDSVPVVPEFTPPFGLSVWMPFNSEAPPVFWTGFHDQREA